MLQCFYVINDFVVGRIDHPVVLGHDRAGRVDQEKRSPMNDLIRGLILGNGCLEGIEQEGFDLAPAWCCAPTPAHTSLSGLPCPGSATQ